jgi:hypothetical protein
VDINIARQDWSFLLPFPSSARLAPGNAVLSFRAVERAVSTSQELNDLKG